MKNIYKLNDKFFPNDRSLINYLKNFKDGDKVNLTFKNLVVLRGGDNDYPLSKPLDPDNPSTDTKIKEITNECISQGFKSVSVGSELFVIVEKIE